ncbi:sulfotransferase family cytosolic 1B member 1 isoform X2 [Aplysia californica]|uniref:Sulfotransferase family cytosolic 1B member 1 isoform X2 n=1 Tax=Aplysia californica TaxID=6500 RepID=A0ABM1VW60_APLCA|nr:sulfotransferase family cytosolic 1B member 1 isoform X2 [Aplysia californica]
MNTKVDEKLQAIVGPRRIITSHLPPKFLPEDIFRKQVKLVYIMRNSKDTLVSWYDMASKYEQDTVRFQGTWEEFLELQLAGEYLWGSWFEHVLAWEKFMSDNPEVPVFVAQYEKLKEQPADVIRDLCRFLGQPDTLAEQIATATSFDNMKAGTQKKKVWHQSSRKDPGDTTDGEVHDFTADKSHTKLLLGNSARKARTVKPTNAVR